MPGLPHDYVPAQLGHSATFCKFCGGTPAENAALGESARCLMRPATAGVLHAQAQQVVVELDVPGVPVTRITMSRVPAINEIIRILRTDNGITVAALFKVTRVAHNANTVEYPKRDGELDAWITGVEEKGSL